MSASKTLFAQIMEFVTCPSGRIVARYEVSAGVRRMTCAEQFRVMAFAQLTWRESLRNIEPTLGAIASKLYAMGLRHSIHCSTLADANEARDWRIWAAVAALLIRRARKLYSDTDLFGLDWKNTVSALHALLDLRGAIPAFIHISNSKMHEVNVLDLMPIETDAFYVVDRVYLDFTRLYALRYAGGFFVTCAKANMNAHRFYSVHVDRSTGVICDQTILLNRFYATQHYSESLRSIGLKDIESGKTLIFLTNNFVLPPLTIAALYKSRWQVELFFKWIEQHLRIKKFLSNSENAVKTQIWCAVSTCVLIAIVKKEFQINTSLYTLRQLLSVSVFEKTEFSSAFQGDALASDLLDSANRLNLLGN